MKKIFLALVSVFSALCVNAETTWTIPNVEILKGGTTEIAITISSSDYVINTYQMNLHLPTGISTSTIRKGIAATHSIAVSASGVVTCIDLDKAAAFTSATGVTAYVTIVDDGTHDVGDVLNATFDGVICGSRDNGGGDINCAGGAFTITVVNTVTLDENETAAPADASGVDVVVNRTLKADVWNTICLPFPVANPTSVFGAGTQVADFTGVTDGDDAASGDGLESLTIDFATATTMEANHPYMIKVPAAMSQFSVSNVDIAAEDEPSVQCDKTKYGKVYYYNSFYGTYVSPTTIPAADEDYTYIFMQNNNFVASDGTATLKAFRGYFEFGVSILSPSAWATSPTKAITFDIDGIETSIESIEGFEGASESWYDLNGRKLAAKPATKGIYINNGKKVVIK